MNRFVEFGVLLVIALVIGLALMGFAGWEYVHNKLRKEKKQDAKEARSV